MPFRESATGDVSLLEIDVAGSLNSFVADDFEALVDAVEGAEANGARSLVLAANGAAFSAGANVGAMAGAVRDGTHRQLIDATVVAAHRAVRALRAAPPTVVAVNGVVAGAALGLVCAADVRIACPEASFVAGFVGIGATPDSSLTWTLPRLVGGGRATEMILRNRRVLADEALAWGLVSEVVPRDGLRERALDVARELADGPGLAIRRSRELIAEGWCSSLDAHLDREAESMRASSAGAEFVEGVTAFAERRTPDHRRVADSRA